MRRLVALLSVCPYCAVGRIPSNNDWADPEAEMVDCDRCQGTGDLLLVWLREAYLCGRRDALEQANMMLRQVSDALELPLPAGVTSRSIRERIIP
jgi:hypothetical protein